MSSGIVIILGFANLLVEKLLEEKLEIVERARTWSPRAVAKLESLIRSGEDRALFRINPLAYAGERALPENEAVDLFVIASHVGLFEMDWHLICPGCTGVMQSLKTLKHLHSSAFCTFFRPRLLRRMPWSTVFTAALRVGDSRPRSWCA